MPTNNKLSSTSEILLFFPQHKQTPILYTQTYKHKPTQTILYIRTYRHTPKCPLNRQTQNLLKADLSVSSNEHQPTPSQHRAALSVQSCEVLQILSQHKAALSQFQLTIWRIAPSSFGRIGKTGKCRSIRTTSFLLFDSWRKQLDDTRQLTRTLVGCSFLHFCT